MAESKWERVTWGRLAGFAAGLGVFGWLLWRSEPGFVVFVDHANLLFHEAGHPMVGLLSRRLEPYGGTVGQLFFPALLVVVFWRRGDALGVSGCGIWFFENGLNIARYLADARRMALPLVGGGDHDWHTILSRWGLLAYDTRMAAALRVVAWSGMAVCCVWLGWRVWQDQRQEVRAMSRAE